MKKLVVCGDSYMASMAYNELDLDNGYNCHFTELLARKLGWEVVTFAMAGCDNQVIRLQIDEVIKEKPDCVIIGTTSTDRMMLPLYNSDEYYNKFKSNDNLYNINDGLYNVDYTKSPNTSATNSNFKKINSKFMTMLNAGFVFENKLNLNKNELEYLQFWYDRFYDSNLKKLQDSWIISNGLRKLKDNNIKFFCINNFLINSEFYIFGDSIITNNSELNPWSYYDDSNKYWFHTTLESQEILANNWYSIFIKHDIIKFI